MTATDKSLSELIEQWQTNNKAYRLEGATGVRNLQKLCEAIGYEEGAFLGSDVAIINFLADNSGAIEAIIDWMGETDIDEWKEELQSEDDHDNEEE